MGGRGALFDEVEIGACGGCGAREEDEPDVDAEFGLDVVLVVW